jgi:hypothetical protein
MILPSSLVTPLKGWPGLVPNCARPTRAFRGRALREHGGPTRLPLSLLADFFSILLIRHLTFLKQLIQYHISLFWIFIVLKRLGKIVQGTLAFSFL